MCGWVAGAVRRPRVWRIREALPWMLVLLILVPLLPLHALAGPTSEMQAMRLPNGQWVDLGDVDAMHPWAHAPVFEAFHERRPVFGAKPRDRTTAQVVFDDQALYVRVACFDRQPQDIRAELVRRDRVDSSQDSVAVYIDPIGRRQAAQVFKVNAAGSIADGLRTAAEDAEDLSPDFDFEARSVRTSSGYVAMFRIPLSSLRFGSEQRGKWRLMVVRTVPREAYYLWTSVPIPLDASSFIASLPELDGFALGATKDMWLLQPHLTLRRLSSKVDGNAISRDSEARVGIDGKWRPMAELVVDGTFRPDFSQLALDVPQLSGNQAFSLLLPEKRPFFFESSDLLQSPSNAIHTRSLSAPRWGVRATWRDEIQSATGFLVNDEGGGKTLLPHAFGTGEAKQPGSLALAARMQRALDPQGRLQFGALFVSRRYEEDRGFNTSFGPDVSWQSEGPWRFRGQWLYSETTAQPTADGDVRRGVRTSGTLLQAKAVRQTEELNLEFSFEDVGAGYRNDTGFINQAGVRRAKLHQGRAFRGLSGISELWLNLDEEVVVDRESGRLVLGAITPGVWFATPNNTQLTIECHCLSRLRTSEQSSILDQRYLYLLATLPPSGRMTRAELSLSLGQLADYVAEHTKPGGVFTAAVALRPLQSLEMEPSLSWAWLRGHGSQRYEESALQLLSVWHLSPTQNLRLIVQRKAAMRGTGDSPTSRANGNEASLTYAYTPALGSALFMGLNRGSRADLTSPRQRSTEAFVKLHRQFF